jgi:cytochrome P450 family 4
LAIFPEIQEKVFQELHDVLPSQDCEITAEDLNKLVYLDWTLKESMRLYPLAPILLRYCTGDVQVGKCKTK